MQTISSVTMTIQWQRWYGLSRSKNQVAKDVHITSLGLLIWFMGDGNRRKNNIQLSTHSFTKQSNDLLAHCLLQQVGITAKVLPVRDKRTQKCYYILNITGRNNLTWFLEFIERSPTDALNLAKQLYPWKFDENLLRRDIYNLKKKHVDENWLQTFLSLCKINGVNIKERREQLNHLFPWKFP